MVIEIYYLMMSYFYIKVNNFINVIFVSLFICLWLFKVYIVFLMVFLFIFWWDFKILV